MSKRPISSVAVAALVIAACGGGGSAPDPTEPPPTTARVTTTRPAGSVLLSSEGRPLGPAPEVTGGPTDPDLLAALDALLTAAEAELTVDHVQALAGHGDARVAWFISDLLRFIQTGPVSEALVVAFNDLTGTEVVFNPFGSPWKEVTDHLIAWDLPTFEEYPSYKARLFTLVEPGWELLFADREAQIDWRLVSWGGVFIDDRSLGVVEGCPRGCIPALDDPAVTAAEEGDWYPDEAIVFGVVVGDEARAYPKHIMEVHEMVNDTVGGRRIGMPYCTLCGSAQAYLTDSVPAGVEVPVLRTSGLLSRSNKVMYDLLTSSVFDTFTGRALSGPLREAGIELEQITVVTSTWAGWRAAYPDTTIVSEDGGIGRTYPPDPLGGRDDDGPIFPVGDVDPRFDAHARVIGVLAADGTAVAFPVGEAELATREGETVESRGVRLVAHGTGFRALSADGTELVAHQAFWFAWSQFHPDTVVWDG